MGPQRASAQDAGAPDGFGVAVVREDGKWRCSPMRSSALTSLAAAETELRELRSAGAVFGLLDVDDEFFVIVRPAPVIVPPVQFIWLSTVTDWLPPIVPLSWSNNEGVTAPMPLKFTVPPERTSVLLVQM